MAGSGVLYEGLHILGSGAILTGLVLAAIAVFVIERKFETAAIFAVAGAVLTFFGFMHGEAIGVNVTPMVALAYAMVAGFLYALRADGDGGRRPSTGTDGSSPPNEETIRCAISTRLAGPGRPRHRGGVSRRVWRSSSGDRAEMAEILDAVALDEDELALAPVFCRPTGRMTSRERSDGPWATAAEIAAAVACRRGLRPRRDRRGPRADRGRQPRASTPTPT